jgi:hypothetical protein
MPRPSRTGQAAPQGSPRPTSTREYQNYNQDRINAATLLEVAPIVEIEGKTATGYPASKYELPAAEELFSTYPTGPGDGNSSSEWDRYRHRFGSAADEMNHFSKSYDGSRVSDDSAIDVSDTLYSDEDIENFLRHKFVDENGVDYPREVIFNNFLSMNNEDIIPFFSVDDQFIENQYGYPPLTEYYDTQSTQWLCPPLPEIGRLDVPVSGIDRAKSPGSAYCSSLSSASGTFSSITTSDAPNEDYSPCSRQPSATPLWIPIGTSENQAGDSLATPIIIISDEDSSDAMQHQGQTRTFEDAATIYDLPPSNLASAWPCFNHISENSVPLIRISHLDGTDEVIKPSNNNGLYKTIETQTETLLTAPVLQRLDSKVDYLDDFKFGYSESSITLKTPPGKSEAHEQKSSNQTSDCHSLSSHQPRYAFPQDTIGAIDLERGSCAEVPASLTSTDDLEDYSEAETDDSFEDDGSITTTSSHGIISLSPSQQQLYENLMRVFWERHNAIDFTAYEGLKARRNGSSQPSSSSYGTKQSSSGQTGPLHSSNHTTPVSTNLKRRREDDEPDPREGQGKEPKRPLSGIPQGQEKSAFPLACPFRKHNPQKYCLRDYEICANHSWDQIHRLK